MCRCLCHWTERMMHCVITLLSLLTFLCFSKTSLFWCFLQSRDNRQKCTSLLCIYFQKDPHFLGNFFSCHSCRFVQLMQTNYTRGTNRHPSYNSPDLPWLQSQKIINKFNVSCWTVIHTMAITKPLANYLQCYALSAAFCVRKMVSLVGSLWWLMCYFGWKEQRQWKNSLHQLCDLLGMEACKQIKISISFY